MADFDVSRRFGGVGRVYGKSALARFQAARVCVVGIGGVGSWAAEALARSAIGKIALIDLDMIAESNVNRQIHALGDVFGQAKVAQMAERLQAIHPGCEIEAIEDFAAPDNLDSLFDGKFDCIIDAIDNARTKAAIIAWCKERAIPIVTAGGAGGRVDPACIGIDDLSRAYQDPLLSSVRTRLRRERGFPRGMKKFGVPAVFSSEPVRRPRGNDDPCSAKPASGLNCAGYGSSVCVTAVFGFFAASEALRRLASEKSGDVPEPVKKER